MKQLKGDEKKKMDESFSCDPLKWVVTWSAVIALWLLTKCCACVSSAALAEPEICYVLDGILFLYGIILTALYCRIKVCMLHICLTRNIHGQELNMNKIHVCHHMQFIFFYFLFMELNLFCIVWWTTFLNVIRHITDVRVKNRVSSAK